MLDVGCSYNHLFRLSRPDGRSLADSAGSALGKLEIKWRGSMGEVGRLQTQQILGTPAPAKVCLSPCVFTHRCKRNVLGCISWNACTANIPGGAVHRLQHVAQCSYHAVTLGFDGDSESRIGKEAFLMHTAAVTWQGTKCYVTLRQGCFLADCWRWF